MDVEVTQRRERQTETITIWGHIAPVARPTRDGRSYWIPTLVKLEWNRYAVNGSGWGNWVPSLIVEGPKSRVDGTTYGKYVDLVESSDPEWKVWVDEHRPSQDLGS